MTAISNIIANGLRPGYAREMLHKVGLRWRERNSRGECAAVRQWCAAQASDARRWAKRIDPALWDEASHFAAEQAAIAKAKLAPIGADLGGGGAYDLLYFLTRLLRPQVVVETGVAAGFSSRAFLHALAKNGGGTLLSSDFPYFRLAEPEKYVGILVEPEFRAHWTPLLKGDRTNLPEIAAGTDRVDLFHYDSDKSYEGRAFALRQMGPKFADQTVVIFDDIQDNWHFRDTTEGKDRLVFSFEGKWIGVTGGPKSFYDRT
jgi:predicted O-methyltransferase YrrM